MSGRSKSGWQFWIDRGGTFTDIVARRPDGQLVVHKLLSENPERYADAPLQGIREILGLETEAPIPAEQIAAVKMGTTVAKFRNRFAFRLNSGVRRGLFGQQLNAGRL